MTVEWGVAVLLKRSLKPGLPELVSGSLLVLGGEIHLRFGGNYRRAAAAANYR